MLALIEDRNAEPVTRSYVLAEAMALIQHRLGFKSLRRQGFELLWGKKA